MIHNVILMIMHVRRLFHHVAQLCQFGCVMLLLYKRLLSNISKQEMRSTIIYFLVRLYIICLVLERKHSLYYSLEVPLKR